VNRNAGLGRHNRATPPHGEEGAMRRFLVIRTVSCHPCGIRGLGVPMHVPQFSILVGPRPT